MPRRPIVVALAVVALLTPARPARAESGAVAVRHLDQLRDGWDVAETANFRVFHHDERDFAERAARVAEGTRTALLRKWFGDDGADWEVRCDLYLYAGGREFCRSTGVLAGVPGVSTIKAEGEHVLERRIDVHGDEETVLAAVLPHEVTHVVVAGRFGDRRVPRWADEGMAVLTEPHDRADAFRGRLPLYRRDGRLFSARALLDFPDYPARHDLDVFYAESVSLVEFLSRARGPRRFVRFVRDGLRDGYGAALESDYGWDFDELERRWREYAFGDGAEQ